MKKKSNGFVRFFKAIGRCIRNFFFIIIYGIAFIFVYPFGKYKVVGKKKVKKDDEARAFIANHYELVGPVSMFMSFPFKFRPWIIDKMMNEEMVKQQMGLMVYNNYKGVPMFFKKFIVKTLGNLTAFVMTHMAHGIAVSREDIRANFKTFEESTKTMEKGVDIAIWPELSYVKEGVGVFQTGFEHIAKYYHKKTGKRISFYPIFISKDLRTIYIADPVVYNPDADPNSEKERIVNATREAMLDMYKTYELENTKLQAKRAKKRAKQELKEKKKLAKIAKREEKNAKLKENN